MREAHRWSFSIFPVGSPIVTGGNGGIGLGMALGMARAGATIVVAGRDAAKNAAAVKQIEAARRQGKRHPGRRPQGGILPGADRRDT